MATPSSQKADARPISFLLDDATTGYFRSVDLVVRPEDLTRSEPGLMNAIQTFDGAFLDDFGPGVARIDISGNTGWRSGAGWEANFKALHDNVWSEWHRRRKDAVKRGQHPDQVRLVFADKLDDIVGVVAPGVFTLKRSKSSPLLMRYQINMTLLTEALTDELVDHLDFRTAGAPDVGLLGKGSDSLSASIAKIKSASARLNGMIDANLVQPVRAFMNTSTSLFGAVTDAAKASAGLVTGTMAQLVGVASDIAMVGRNAFYTFNAVAGLPDLVQKELGEVAAAYENAMCVLQNAFRKTRTYQQFDGIYGASVCSSTVGGSPLSQFSATNPFESFVPTVAAPSSVSAAAKSAMDAVKASDPVLAPVSPTAMGALLSTVTAGVSV